MENIPGVSHKLSWRITLLRKAILSGRVADWKGVLKEVFSAHRRIAQPVIPPPLLIREENDLGLYQVADKRVYFPLAFDPSLLGDMYHEIFVQKVYESESCQIRPGDWVIDAGACEGFFSLYALEKGANVLAFEPVPEIAQALERTLEPFIREGRARVFPVGLGSTQERQKMWVVKGRATWSTFSENSLLFLSHNDPSSERTSLEIVAFDILAEKEVLPPISFLKADVEGYERELLLGAKETIQKYKPRLSICTYHLPDDWQVIPQIIRSFEVGYRVKFRGGFFEHVYGW